MLRRLFASLKGLLRRSAIDLELEEELQFHVEMETQKHIERGMSPGEARRVALRDLGGVTQTKEAVRDERTTWFDTTASDLRYGLRLLLRNPGLGAVVVLTLALGIGANTAVFGLIRAVLLRPLPYDQPDRLVAIASSYVALEGKPARGILTGSDVHGIVGHATTLGETAVTHQYSAELSSPIDLFLPEGAERLRGGLVTPNFFRMLGVQAQLGRVFERSEAQEGVAVLSDGYWRRKFGADPRVVGRTVDLMLVGRFEQTPRRFTIIGVLPPRFRFTYPRETELWAVLPWRTIKPGGAAQYQIVARLAPGRTPAEVSAELTAIKRRRDEANGLNVGKWRDRTLHVATSLPERAAAESRPGMLLLSAVAAVVLLIACIDVVLLLLARAEERRREMAVRRALGAGTARMSRQLLTETGVLVLMGGVLGTIMAVALQPALRAIVPSTVTRGDELTIDLPVLAFALGLCVVLTLVCGLAPLWRLSTTSLQDALRQAQVSASGSARVVAWRRAVIGVQVAVVLVLLVCGALLLRSFWHLRHVDLGYEGTGLLTLEMRAMRRDNVDPTHAKWFQRELLDRIRALPGVTDASLTTSVPMRGVDFHMVVGAVGGTEQSVRARSVDPHYFSLMRIPVLSGRGFTDHDTDTSPPVVVVSQSYARLLFGDRNPLGQRLDLDEIKPEIVGVVGDVRHASVKLPASPAFYQPRAQKPNSVMCVIVRTKTDLNATADAVVKVVRALDPRQPVERVTTLDGIVADTTADDRFYTAVTAAFGAIGLALAVAGLLGAARRATAERKKELAIRLALGASPTRLVNLTLLQEMRPVFVGGAVGLVGAYWLSRLLARFLFEVSPLDPWAYGLACALLVGVAAIGCYFPARGVMFIQPQEVLRAE